MPKKELPGWGCAKGGGTGTHQPGQTLPVLWQRLQRLDEQMWLQVVAQRLFLTDVASSARPPGHQAGACAWRVSEIP